MNSETTTNNQAPVIGIPLEYGEIKEIPFPEEVKEVDFLGKNHYTISNGKIFGRLTGVVRKNGETLFPMEKNKSNFWYKASFEMLGEENILVKGKSHYICDLDGKITATYKSVKQINDQLLAVTSGKLLAIAKLDGTKLSEEQFDEVRGMVDDIAIAKRGKEFVGINEDASIAFTLSGVKEVFDFCNGYARFRKGYKYGAIDKDGKVVLQPDWVWLRDCECDSFVFCKKEMPTVHDTLGVVAVGGQILLPCNYYNLEYIGENLLRHGKLVTYSYQEDNKVYTLSKIGYGVIDITGKVIAPDGILWTGKESEGLRAYARYYSDDDIEFGYLDENWNTKIKVARFGTLPYMKQLFYTSALQLVFRRELGDYLAPFYLGKAQVKFMDSGLYAKDDRWIDRTGRATDPGEKYKKGEKNKKGEKHKKDETAKADGTDTSGLPLAKKIIKNLDRRYQVANLKNMPKKAIMFAPNLWMLTFDNNHIEFMISKLESPSGFACGMLLVKVKGKEKYGFIDQTGEVAIEAKYDEAHSFRNNHTRARIGNRHYILTREAIVNNGDPTTLDIGSIVQAQAEEPSQPV